MSIQPVRVIGRMIDQVDQSDWPRLEGRFVASAEGQGSYRFYRAPHHPRYATPFHFWVHALREERAAVGQREDLVGVASHAMCRGVALADFVSELEALSLEGNATATEMLGLSDVSPETLSASIAAASREGIVAYEMLDSSCRRSGLASHGGEFMAYFWGHGFLQSWRTRGIARARPIAR